MLLLGLEIEAVGQVTGSIIYKTELYLDYWLRIFSVIGYGRVIVQTSDAVG